MPPENGERATVKLSLPLEYQQELYQELQTQDELVVLARGLGLLRIVANLLHTFEAAGNNLVFVIGADERENQWIAETLLELAAVSQNPACQGLSIVNTDSMSIDARERAYQKGGIISITSRILITDLIIDLVDPATITGLVVLHADRVTSVSIEAFITRVYRQKNKNGFIKAFADDPIPLSAGFTPLATVMKNLFLSKASLWPRFHLTVAKALEGKKKAEVIDLEVPMTDAMRDIQGAILECLEGSIKELKKANPGLDMEDWTLDNAKTKSFDRIVRRQLDPNWHRTTPRTKQIVNDLRTLQDLLGYLLSYDAVSFYKHLETILVTSNPSPNSTRQNQSPWLLTDAANIIFATAKQRIYRSSLERDGATNPDNIPANSSQLVLEEQPKWTILSETLDEINQDLYLNPSASHASNGAILIMCADVRTCAQIRQYLQTKHINFNKADPSSGSSGDSESSAGLMMREKLQNYLKWKPKLSAVHKFLQEETQKDLETSKADQSRAHVYRGKPPPNKRRRVRGGAAVIVSTRDTGSGALLTPGNSMTLNELSATLGQQNLNDKDNDDDSEDYFDLYDMQDIIVVHSYEGDSDEQLLEDFKPRYIIMYEPDATFIRRVEVYRSSHRNRQVRVYFMYYGSSVEEERYLNSVRREKDSFEKLIRERGSMAQTLTTDGRTLDSQEVFLRTINTRVAGGGRLAATAEQPMIAVDIREMRSALPNLLHGHGIRVIPVNLTVGDYILTPDIAVERKSLSDLISSLNNGRLFNQVESMLKHYKSAVLLIEFDASKTFTLEAFADYNQSSKSSSTSANGAAASAAKVPTDLSAKLVLLTIAFPKLRTVWSSSPHQSSIIFQSLKTMNPEPDPLTAARIGLDPGSVGIEDVVWNEDPQDMLRCVGGIDPKNIDRVILNGGSLVDVANWELADAERILGKEKGGQVHRFFNKPLDGN